MRIWITIGVWNLIIWRVNSLLVPLPLRKTISTWQTPSLKERINSSSLKSDQCDFRLFSNAPTTTNGDSNGAIFEEQNEKSQAINSLIYDQAVSLGIPYARIPNLPAKLNFASDYNKFMTATSEKLIPRYSSTPSLLLALFIFMSENSQIPAEKPDVTTFNIVLNSFAKTNQLENMKHFFESVENGNLISDGVPIQPDTISYNILLDAFTRNQDLEEVLNIFQNQIQNKQGKKQQSSIKPNIITLNTIIKAYAKSKQYMKAQKLLETMESTYNIKPDVVSYTSVIDAFAKIGDAARAETILKTMIQNRNAETSKSIPLPNCETFNAVLNAWGRSNIKNAAQRAESLLNLMVEMSTISSSSTTTSRKNLNIQIPQPNVCSFNTVLNAYSRVGDGLGSEELLDAMVDNDSPLHVPGVEPDLITYNTVMTAYARSGHLNCHKDVTRIMNKMEKDCKSPDVFSYTTLINAYARSREKGAAYRADQIFQQMKKEGITPNVNTYNAIMNCWVKSREKGSVSRAHELLIEMIEDKLIQDPNVKTYTIVIDALAKSRENNAARRAEKLLEYMENRYEATNDPNAQPNVQTYTAVINAWGRSQEKGKAQRAVFILNRMKEYFKNGKNDKIKPNVFTYNAVLNACAYTNGDDREQDEIFRTACNVFDELRNLRNEKDESLIGIDDYYYRPNHVTYGTFLQVCTRLLPKGDNLSRKTIVEAIFRKCCQDGQVGIYALEQFWEAAPRDLYWALLEEGNEEKVSRRRTWGDDEMITVADLPSKWTKNVRERIR